MDAYSDAAPDAAGWDRRAWLKAAPALGLSGWLGMGHAAPAGRPPLPMDAFFRPAELGSVSLAPDGKALLALRKVDDRMNLLVVDLVSNSAKLITSFKSADVGGARWISNTRIAFQLGVRVSDNANVRGGMHTVEKDGTDYRAPEGELARASFFSTGRTQPPGTVIVSMFEQKGHSALYRMNTRTGKGERLSRGAPGIVANWALDAQDRPRAVITREPEAHFQLWVRPEPEGSWVPVRRWRELLESDISLEGIDSDEVLYVLARPEGRDETGLMAIDLKTAKMRPDPLVILDGYDVSPGAARFSHKGDLLMVRFQADRPRTLYVDPDLDALQTAMEAEFKDRTVSLQPSRDGAMVLVSVSGDVDPGQYFLFQKESKRLQPVGKARPWINPADMAPTRFFRYAARDGLSIPANLTLPPGAQPGQKHPLLVLHYGGPHVRAISWGFDQTVQFLASRGYAVFMPAPRMSTEWGRKHFESGFKQWGLAMQDDVTDGVLHLVKEGIADRDRLAIMGASYGGYLTMMGLVKNPELWRCGVNWVGVTDPAHMYLNWTDFAEGDSDKYRLPIMLGHPERDAEQFARTSPLKRVAEIQAPVLLAYGGADQRVPLANGTRMHQALKEAGKTVEYVMYPEEGHGFRATANVRDFWGRVEKFLALHMAPRA
jgi:dipeptidyl aminopeptidase/acylaminoacyl peptidase